MMLVARQVVTIEFERMNASTTATIAQVGYEKLCISLTLESSTKSREYHTG
jgi:hypothetical protein